MRAQLRVLGVPLHPLLVHFPIAFWFVVPPLDIAALYAGFEPLWYFSEGAAILGVAFGLASIATGLLDYLQPSLVGIDLKLAARHGFRTIAAWCVFTARAVAAAFSVPAGFLVILDVLGLAFLVQGVYFGTRQVYQQLEGD